MKKDGLQNQIEQFGYDNSHTFILMCLKGITKSEHYTLNEIVFKKNTQA